jgi:hypothetical protein
MRTVSTALEAYFVDTNTYVACASAAVKGDGNNGAAGTGVPTVNSSLNGNSSYAAQTESPAGAQFRITFGTYRPGQDNGKGQSLTTPVAYLTSFQADPFADTKGAAFGYYNGRDAGWIMWSYGPDTDENVGKGTAKGGGQLQSYLWKVADITLETVYNPYTANPTAQLMADQDKVYGEAFTYDATNGSTSKGDVWRVKQ